MAGPGPRKAQRTRWRNQIVSHLGDFPRQYAALEFAMAYFGDDFDLLQFKDAFNTSTDMEAYNRVQAVERGVGRVQNYVDELADNSVNLASLNRPPMAADGSTAEQAFDALRDAGVISGELCRMLTRAHKARTRIEHSYVKVPAGDVHAAATLVHKAAREFIASYRSWIGAYLDDQEP